MQQRKDDDNLRTALLPFLLQYPGLSFQQDNTRTHMERAAMNWHTAYQIYPWPARSIAFPLGDLAPFEQASLFTYLKIIF
ncbi:hypothetical protein TNCV_2709141 [Trichonephila clavipes]|nr:hypothetical protein TNCV_2709141 [Trichonephila clavipes]